MSRFAADRGIVGKTIPLDGHSATILGVLPPDFELPTLEHADVVVPQAMDEAAQHRPNTGRVLQSVARLKPGVTPEQAAAALQPLFQESLQFRSRAIPQGGQTAGTRAPRPPDPRCAPGLLDSARRGAGRAADRLRQRREPLVGAGRHPPPGACGAPRAGRHPRPAMCARPSPKACSWRLPEARQDALLAVALLRIFVSHRAGRHPRLQQATVDLRVLLFTLAISLFSGVVFGLGPRPRTRRAPKPWPDGAPSAPAIAFSVTPW